MKEGYKCTELLTHDDSIIKESRIKEFIDVLIIKYPELSEEISSINKENKIIKKKFKSQNHEMIITLNILYKDGVYNITEYCILEKDMK